MQRNTCMLILAAALFAASGAGCKKDAKNVIDCFGESLLVSVKASADGTNAKLIHFTAGYSGSLTVSSVAWDYGDGKSETLTSTTSTHTYTAAGSYTVTAKIKLINGGSECTPAPKKVITVN